MKIDRVLFSLNSNPVYTGFWNIVSKIYSKAFQIEPTLIFYGSKGEAKDASLSEEFGKIIFIPRYDEFTLNKKREWYVPWTLFYVASKFENDVCMTSGIDQIPLSSIFIDEIAKYDDNKYVVAFSDAYDDGYFYPSSHHVGKGKLYKKIFEVGETFDGEISKILSFKKDYAHELDFDLWGLDEKYSSKMINEYEDKSSILLLKNFFHDTWKPRRLDRGSISRTGYVREKAQAKFYSEFHSVRPYENFKTEIDQLIFEVYGF